MPEHETPLLPRKLFFGNPDKAGAQLSPDGTSLGFLAPVGGVLNVWVGPAGTAAEAQPVTQDTGRGIRFYGWAYTNRHILYIQDKGGDENWRLYCVDLQTGETKDLTPLDGVQAHIQELSPETPDEILVALNDRRPELHDIYRVNLHTGERTLVQQNDDGFAGFLTDDRLTVRLAMRMTADGGSEYLKPAADGRWDPFLRLAMEDTLTFRPFGFDKGGHTVYVSDSRNRDTAALLALDLETGASTLLAEDPQADIVDVMTHPTEKTIQAAASMYERKRWQRLDDAVAGDLDFLRTVADGDIEVTSRTLDDRYWIVVYLLDSGPARYYRYDRANRTAHFLFSNRAALDGQPLVKMWPVVIPTRDDFKLVCYYSLPAASGAERQDRPDRPLPLVLLVHGGPWGRDVWGYNGLHQWLANRGYAVLSVNFRASTGFGKAFLNAGNHEWSGRMHDDLLDAVQWAIQAGIADRDRVAIMGGSYGGYATLVGLTFTPDVFACGVDIVGPSNIITLLESIPPYWQPQIELFATRVGDHRTEEGKAFLADRSPLNRADSIRRPLLIGQGANDPRVKQAESDQIVRAMREHTIPVTYVLYPDEGHGFARPQNNLSFYAITEAFLGQCLGGRVEPIGDDFSGSSVTVPTGAENIAGLSAALPVG